MLFICLKDCENSNRNHRLFRTVSNYPATSPEICGESDTADVVENDWELETSASTSTETPARQKRSRLDARFNDVLDKVEAMCTPDNPSRHAAFAKYLCERLELLPLSVARSLEVELLTRVHSVIDEFENVDVGENNV